MQWKSNISLKHVFYVSAVCHLSSSRHGLFFFPSDFAFCGSNVTTVLLFDNPGSFFSALDLVYTESQMRFSMSTVLLKSNVPAASARKYSPL